MVVQCCTSKDQLASCIIIRCLGTRIIGAAVWITPYIPSRHVWWKKNIYECKYPWNYSSFKSCDHWLQQFGLVTFCPNPNPLTASRLAFATNAMYQRPCGGFPTIQMLQILEVKRFFFWTVRPRDLCFRGLVRRSIIQLASVVTDNFYTTGVIMGYPMCGVSSTACCHVLQPWYNPWYYPWYNQLWGYLMLP